MAAKKAKSWGELSGGEKKAVLIGWAVIAALLGWIFLPGEEEHAEVPAESTAAAVASPAATYQAASAEALAEANQLMSDLDTAMRDGLPILKTGDLHAMGAHSRRFDSLVESAYTRFGSTVFEPLGRCGVASNFARSGWMAQVDAALKGGVESVPGSVQDALDQFQARRAECLEAANPAGGTETNG